MKKIYEGRTKEDAIREACKDLNVEKENLIIEILEDEVPKKTIFSILDRKRVKIEVQIKQNINKKEESSNKKEKIIKDIKLDSNEINKNIELLEKVLNEFKEYFNEDAFEYKIEKEKNHLNVLIDVNKKSRWIGYRGKTLNALQSVLTAILASNSNQFIKVYVNIGTYKEERKKQLESLAEKVLRTVKKTKKKITLEPMNSYERKIVHDYISKDELLKTESTGDEPNRKVVVSLK